MVRELLQTQYDSKGYTDVNSLAKFQLNQPDVASRKLTYLWGKDSTKFSFLTMTEGQGNAVGVNDVEYTWPVMGKMKHTGEVVSFDNSVVPYPGLNFTAFQVIFKDNWIINQYGLLAPDGITQCRVMREPTPVTNGYLYTLELKTTDPTAYVALSNLDAGKFWIMTAPTVPEGQSRGNRSNIMAPGKMTNQISFHRYTKKITGNLANKVVPIQFDGEDTVDGKPTSLWINEEMKQFEIMIREMNNTDLYTTEYNRNTNGEIFMKDYDNGQPIPHGAGIREIITETGNYDTYGLTLTLQKLKNTVADIFWDATDTGIMEIVLHCGQGFAEDFDNAIKTDVNTNSFFEKLGHESIMSGKDGFLSYGKYFNQYKTITGHVVTLKRDAMFDSGLLAELDKANGNLHPRTGYPMSSHTGVFLDYSMYNGERNISLYHMNGQSEINGVVKGLSPIPASWGVVPVNIFSNDKDESSYEKKVSKGINILKSTHCFILQSTLS